MKLIMIFLLILFAIFNYLILLFVNNCIYINYGLEYNNNYYLIPFIIITICSIIMLICKLISYNIYCYSYIIIMSLFGFLWNMFIFSVFYYIIIKFIQLSEIVGSFLIIIFPICLTIYGFINAYIIQIVNVNLKFKNFKSKKKIAHLSDIHLGAVYQTGFVKRIVQKLLKIDPDVIVITGDIVDGSGSIKKEWLEPFNVINVPILYVTGNHEPIVGKELVLKAMESTSIIHLENDIKNICGMNFIGIDYEYDILNELNKKNLIKNDVPNILLYHVPKIKINDLKNNNIFLGLAGHTHSGQFFPLQLLVWLGNEHFSGLYEKDGTYVFVSDGMGTAEPPMKIGSKNMIGVINIEDE